MTTVESAVVYDRDGDPWYLTPTGGYNTRKDATGGRPMENLQALYGPVTIVPPEPTA